MLPEKNTNFVQRQHKEVGLLVVLVDVESTLWDVQVLNNFQTSGETKIQISLSTSKTGFHLAFRSHGPKELDEFHGLHVLYL